MIVMKALILNRTQVYASARRPVRLAWASRLALRIMPILIFVYQTVVLLQAMRCQTSPDFAALRYNDPSKQLERDFAGSGGPLHWLGSRLLFWQDDRQSCLAVGMTPRTFDLPSVTKASGLKGSSTLMWPLFQSLCLSQFVETLSCAVQGRIVMAETGMTLFEHSLAFAEAESMLGNQLGWGPFGLSKANTMSDMAASTYEGQALQAATGVPRSVVLSRLNTPPEVLLIGLISSLSHLTSQILGVFGIQGRYRLVSTGFWGLCFMAAFLWSLLSFTPGPSGDMGILRFPTVCIVGFIPHMLILMGIFTCAGIYLLALLLSATAPPGSTEPRTLRERFALAQQNLQANIQLSSIRINMHEDFYTSLLKVGFSALTAASEAVFLNEGQSVGVRPWTWLEEQRMKELEVSRGILRGSGFAMPQDFSTGSAVADGVGLVEENADARPRKWKSGFARERTTEKVGASGSSKTRTQGDGVGAAERSGRWIMAWELFRGIFRLVSGGLAILVIKSLDSLGVRRKPQWLMRLARREKSVQEQQGAAESASSSLEFWLLSDEGVLSLPEDEQVDVEVEMWKRLQEGDADGLGGEGDLDSSIYGWWKHGGWFGELDSSGDYQPKDELDDTTSVVSMISGSDSSNVDGDLCESDGVSDGRRTPTQMDPHPQRDLTDEPTLDLTALARLLDPHNADERHEAQLLSRHLDSPGILTRSRFRRTQEQQRAKVLTSTRYRPAHLGGRGERLSGEEESELLEHLILSRRSFMAATSGSTDDTSSAPWASGAEGLGAGGPQCVVCQSSPRTILVWPCRCLSLCEDCRVSLAMNNFGNCVCCRRDVVGFSRIYVP